MLWAIATPSDDIRKHSSMFRWALLAKFTEQDGYFSGFALEDLGIFTTENSDEDTGSEDLGITIAKVGLNEDAPAKFYV